MISTLKGTGLHKVLCIYGGGSVKRNGVYDRVNKSLAEVGIECVELWGVQANPVLAKVQEGIDIAKDPKNKIDCVFAIGGGSVIDTSKTIAAGALYNGNIWDVFQNKVPVPTETLPLYVVLTLSATASENDAGAVVTNPEKKEKLAGMFPHQPVACAVDPTIQMSLPWYQVMAGASDAMSHLMESMFSTDGTSITGQQINFAVQRSIYQAMEIMIKDPNDYNARENFCWAVSLGLRGEAQFGNSFDGNVHSLEHAISAYNDKITHGAGLAALAPAYYTYIYKFSQCKPTLDKWSKEVMGEDDFHKGVKKFHETLVQWKAPAGLKELGITDEKQIDEIVPIMMHEVDDIGVKSRVVPLTEQEVRTIYMNALTN